MDDELKLEKLSMSGTSREDAEAVEGLERHAGRPLPPRSRDFFGKHRLSAAINRLNQEIQYLQAEIDELDTTEPASAACKEVFLSTEGKPDALLPITPGPENAAWERWFQRARARSHKWWTNKGSLSIS